MQRFEWFFKFIYSFRPRPSWKLKLKEECEKRTLIDQLEEMKVEKGIEADRDLEEDMNHIDIDLIIEPDLLANLHSEEADLEKDQRNFFFSIFTQLLVNQREKNTIQSSNLWGKQIYRSRSNLCREEENSRFKREERSRPTSAVSESGNKSPIYELQSASINKVTSSNYPSLIPIV